MTIYTKKGDRGKTSLYISKKRLAKSDPVFEALGSLDELNSYLGICISYVEKKDKDAVFLSRLLREIQSDLMTISSIIAGAKIGLASGRTSHLEKEIDKMEEKLPNLTDFILPGGEKLSAHLMYARSLVRKTERKIDNPSLNYQQKIIIQKYINRLSDYIFVLSRWINKTMHKKEVRWRR